MIFRYSCVYVIATVLVLFFLYFYTGRVAINLVFRSKETSMLNKAEILVSSFSGMDSLNKESVDLVLSLLNIPDIERTIVTNADGRVLYDSYSLQNITDKYALFPEILSALEGNDVFTSDYYSGMFVSASSMPILYRNNLIGAVYLLNIDSDFGDIVSDLLGNFAKISIMLAVLVSSISILFTVIFSVRMRKILHSVQVIREGNYSHKIDLTGSDELARLADEFNTLSDHLSELESVQHQFVSDASHELKTPLASIKLLADSILQNPMDDETIHEFVSDIGQEADRLTRMSHKLLSMSRLEAIPDEQENSEIIEVPEITERVIRMVRPLASLGNIAVCGDYEENCTILCTEDDFYQIMFNLVENAVKYNMENGKVEVSVSKENDDVVIQVTDTGIGIPEKDLQHIFERFYRVDKARSRKSGGSGLGLSIVKEIVEHYYGIVTVRNRPEFHGTIFELRFPWIGTEVAEL